MKPPWIFSTRSSAPTTSAPASRASLLLLALGEDGHPHRLADAVGQHDGAPHHLVGVLGIDPEPQGHVHRLVELGVGQLLEDAERLLDRVVLLAVVDRLGRLQLLRRHWHLGLPCLLRPAVRSARYYRIRFLPFTSSSSSAAGAPTWPPHSPRPRTTVCGSRALGLFRLALLCARRLRCPCCGRCLRWCASRTRWSRCSGPPAWSGRSRAPGRASPCRSCPCAGPRRPSRCRPPA